MTGPNDAPLAPSAPAAPSDDHQEAAEIAAYLAAEGVANDYHPHDVPPDHLPD
ncbi:hypothetical protein LQ327_20350 [Actinomycetospora endophytica]|uniref:Uncharacterized protein n=1 Tax=Actinomycetospora endophytica TaxID=2291215 RepID=A0ABS8PBQ7_9PSEU|nr:hypothetical protein [Actinomycetospora endophytica]MCD2195726.1 hypothetical protein [Actinomycetospora endophytica]